MACGKFVPPISRVDTPRSKSAANSSGSFDAFCSRFSNSAVFVRLRPQQERTIHVYRHGK